MRQGSQHIAEGVSTTSELTARAATASSEASANVRDIASAAEELTSSVQEIERQVSQSNGIAMKAVAEAAQTNVTVKELNEAAGRIGDVVKLINDIAAQTNLLALNATIEAARAGEAGRGFAVVAGEVKALAGQTAKATEEITSQIAAMQSATERSIEATSAIERTIREIGDISGAIAAAVTQQGAATQEIARSVETASKRTSEAAEQVGGVNQIAETTNRHATTARGVADNLGTVAVAHPRAGRSVLPAAERGLRFQFSTSNAASMWRGQRRGATRIASKRMSRLRVVGMIGEPDRGGGRDPLFWRGVTE